MHGAIAPTRGNPGPVGRPRHALYAFDMIAVGGERCAGNSVPDLRGFIKADGDDTLPIGRPGHARYNAGMFEVVSEVFAVHSIPEMHGVVRSRRDDLPAIG